MSVLMPAVIPMHPWQRVRRVIEVPAAALALVALAPLLLLVAGLVWWRLGSPVIFRQVRPGLHGRPFTMYKFRSMVDAHDANGRPLPDAERLTPFGNWLRRTSLDELPELVNVLQGNMSLVGPRPLIMAYLDRYTPEQARRLHVRPGITGLAQVSGRNALTWEERFELDVRYVDEQGPRLDAVILLRTVATVMRRKGIHADGHATMTEFLGSAEPAGGARDGDRR